MRQGVILGSVLALVVVLPAAARMQDETVTLKVGQTVPLKTVFDKSKTYTIVMSGLITRTLNDGGLKVVYDPFHGAQGANCENSGPSVYLQIQDARGSVLDFGDAGRPPCRTDHRYEFVVNDGPVVSDLVGKAKAYITLGEAPGWTTAGSFTLTVRSQSTRRDVKFTVGAKKEARASLKDPLLADVRLSGRGRIADLDGAMTTSGLFQLTLVWLTRDDTTLLLRPKGTWRYNAGTRTVSGPVRVVRSSDGTCMKPRTMTMTISKRRGVARSFLGDCNGVDVVLWTTKSSDLTLSVNEVRVDT